MCAAIHADAADTAAPNQQSADKLHKPIKKFQKHNVYSSFYGLHLGCCYVCC